jgi:putative endonuclease
MGRAIAKWREFVRRILCGGVRGQRRAIGRLGEDIATRFLKRKGFEILRRNWASAKGEIDIVAIDKSCNVLVFVEVKLRAASSMMPGYFAVNAKKRAVLKKTCKSYIRKFTSPSVSYRFDVIDIRSGPNKDNYEVSHYENVALF